MKHPLPELLDSRRLTGPNLFSDQAGAICELAVDPALTVKVVESWSRHARSLLISVRWIDETIFHRVHATGVSVVLTAPIDALYAATELNELAVQYCLAELAGKPRPPGEGVDEMCALIAQERKPDLMALQAAAAQHKLPFLSDDDEASVGYGRGCQSWPLAMLPSPAVVPWSQLSSIPVGLVTGTNGKSTTVRLAASILAAAGRSVGVTSTDDIRVNGRVIEEGDFSGPGGARTLLRNPDTEVALLEAARGGMLRRGLGVTSAEAAVITNVSADHLGEYGIHSVDDMTAAKFVVRRALERGKSLVLNADDESIAQFARGLHAQRIVWFSEHSGHPIVEGHCMAGGLAFVVHEGQITMVDQSRHGIVPVADIPVTMKGLAGYNVQNALAAAALAHLLGAPDAAISKGLTAFGGSAKDNPGRGNLFRGRGIQALVDFAHNAHGLAAVAKTVAKMPAKRRLVMIGQAGDRSDQEIAALMAAAMHAKPDQLIICQIPGYERGREPQEVPHLLHRLAVDQGIGEHQIRHADRPLNGVNAALNWAKPGDFLLLLVLTERGPCFKLLRESLRA